MASPRTVLAPALNCKPKLLPLTAPFNSTTGLLLFGLNPGCVVASMTTASVMASSALVGEMVNGGVPVIWKVIVSGPGLVLADMSACSNEPGPLKLVVVTTKVSPHALAKKPHAVMTSHNLHGHQPTREHFATTFGINSI